MDDFEHPPDNPNEPEQLRLIARMRELREEQCRSMIGELRRYLQEFGDRATVREKEKLATILSMAEQDPQVALRIAAKWRAYQCGRWLETLPRRSKPFSPRLERVIKLLW